MAGKSSTTILLSWPERVMLTSSRRMAKEAPGLKTIEDAVEIRGRCCSPLKRRSAGAAIRKTRPADLRRHRRWSDGRETRPEPLPISHGWCWQRISKRSTQGSVSGFMKVPRVSWNVFQRVVPERQKATGGARSRSVHRNDGHRGGAVNESRSAMNGSRPTLLFRRPELPASSLVKSCVKTDRRGECRSNLT